VDIQPVPGMRSSAYNELFNVAKGADEMLAAGTLRVETALAHVKELCPANMQLPIGTHPYGLNVLSRGG
jgi:hypothetical protein